MALSTEQLRTGSSSVVIRGSRKNQILHGAKGSALLSLLLFGVIQMDSDRNKQYSVVLICESGNA